MVTASAAAAHRRLQVDELLLKKRLREQEIRRAEKALAEIERQLDMLRTP